VCVQGITTAHRCVMSRLRQGTTAASGGVVCGSPPPHTHTHAHAHTCLVLLPPLAPAAAVGGEAARSCLLFCCW
jgi:hypothetical protein